MMSNYSFRDHFTPIQLNVLLASLLTHPNRAFLLDNELSECSNITQPNIFYVAQKGKVNSQAAFPALIESGGAA
jgi:hypothetical protein